MLKLFLLSTFFSTFILCHESSAKTVSADINADLYDELQLLTVPNVELYIDKTDQLNIQDILSENKQLHFIPITDVYKNTEQHPVWIKFSLKTDKEYLERWLNILPAYLEKIDLYIIRNVHVIHHEQSGLSTPKQEKFANISQPLFRLFLKKDEETIVYIRIASQILNIQKIGLWKPALFLQQELLSQIIRAAVLGIYAFIIIASFWFECVIKNNVYKAFALYVGSCLLFNSIEAGWWYPFVSISSVTWYAIAIMWIIPRGIIFFLKFAKADQLYPKRSKWMQTLLLVYAYTMTVLFLVFSHETNMLVDIDNISTLIFLPIGIALIWKPISRSDPGERYVCFFLLGLLTISTFWVTLELLGFVAKTEIIEELPFIVSTLFFVAVFYLLSRQYKKMREERDVAMHNLLVVTQNSEKELAQQVKEKTRDIVAAHIEIEKTLNRERQAYKDRNNFLAMVSHEFRTPLAIISATVQNLFRIQKNDIVEKKLKKIQMSVNHLSALMNDYLSQDRLNLLSQFIDKKSINIDTLVHTTIDIALYLSPDHHILYTRNIDNSDIWGDADSLKLVLQTLVENAVKYTPAKTKIHIIVYQSEQNWIIDVIDNGPGIPDLEKERVFEEYYRADSSLNQSGTGLGLSLARYLMQMQNGSLTLSDANEHGCCFSVVLPFKENSLTTILSSQSSVISR